MFLGPSPFFLPRICRCVEQTPCAIAKGLVLLTGFDCESGKSAQSVGLSPARKPAGRAGRSQHRPGASWSIPRPPGSSTTSTRSEPASERTAEKDGVPSGYRSKSIHQGTAGFSPCFHSPGFLVGTGFLTHSQVGNSQQLRFPVK